METLTSRLDAASDAYAANKEAQLTLASELRARLAAAALG
jgi:3-methylcrotonyl-CoA carboxylase beta subunit